MSTPATLPMAEYVATGKQLTQQFNRSTYDRPQKLTQMFAKVSFVSSTLAALLTLTFAIKGQQPSPTPFPKPSSRTSDEIRNDSSVDQKSEPTPAPSPELDFWHQETMTGDWGGT